MDARICYTNDQGGVSIVTPIASSRAQLLVKEATWKVIQIEGKPDRYEMSKPPEYRDETDDEFLKRVAELSCEGKPYIILKEKDMPKTREGRANWKIEGKKIKNG